MKKVLSVALFAAFLLPSIALTALAATPAPAVPTTPTASAPSIVTACSTLKTQGLAGVVSCVVGIFNAAITLMVAASIVVIVWGAFKMIYSEEGRTAGRETVIYGIIGLFVMISIWGFVNILDKTFNLSGVAPITPPRITIPGFN